MTLWTSMKLKTPSLSVATFGLPWALGALLNAAEPAFPLRVSASRRHLEDQRGLAFFVNGDAAWSLTHNLTYEEAVRYMQNRRAKGINALIVSVPDAYAPDGGASSPPDRQGNQPFVGSDLSLPNEAYWQHVDRVLGKSEEMGFLVLLWPFYLGCCSDGYMDFFLENGAAKTRAYGRFVGQRYAGRKNLVWVHGGDHDPGTAEGLVAAAKDWLHAAGHNPAGTRDLVAAVRAGITDAGGTQLHAAHWAPETEPYTPFGEAFTDLYTTYTYGPVAAHISHNYEHRPVKPVLLLETHYENDWAGKNADEVRRYPYRAVLAGAAGHFFGNKPLWFCGNGWEAALDSPGSRSMEYVGRLFRSRRWEQLVPEEAGRFVSAGGGDPASDDGVQAARAADGSFAMAFLPSRRTTEVDLGRISGPSARAWWFDISTGTATDAGQFPTGRRQSFTPPLAGSFVLVLDDARLGLPAPGLDRPR
jgi:hypothetical protein